VPAAHEGVDDDTIEDLELDDADADPGEPAGGLSPSPPSGPVPIPYPNVRP
jgi:hypothetical protein